MNSNKRTEKLYFILIIFIALILGYCVMVQLKSWIGDEDYHRFHIHWFMEGRFEVLDGLTVLPFYHSIMAVVGKLFGGEMQVLRFIGMCFSALSIFAFYCLCRSVSASDVERKTLLYMLMPIVFPYFFLIYTDLPTLIFIFFCIERAIKRKYLLSAIFGLFAILMRQTSIILVMYAAVICIFQEGLFRLSFNSFKTAVKKLWPYVLICLLFAAFVLINRGVSFGDVEKQSVSFNISQFYFFLFVSFLIFLPLNIEYSLRVSKLVWRHKWLMAIIVLFTILVWFTFNHDHPYNSSALEFYRHNWLLHYIIDFPTLRILSAVCMSWMALTFYLAIGRHEQKFYFYSLGVFLLCSTIPLPLIEHRYYIPFMAIFMALNQHQSEKGQWVTLFLYTLVSAYFMYSISHNTFIL